MVFDPDHFWNKVHVTDQCWLWMAGTDSAGYGKYKYNGVDYRSHVVAFAIHTGIFPSERVIRHTCNNKRCCNPAHLIDGTQKENIEDAVIAGTMKGNPKGLSSPGQFNSNTSLTEDDVREIRRLGIFFGATYIANLPQFKGRIGKDGVWHILQGNSWKGVY